MRRFLKFFLFFLIITSWLMSGWPAIWQHPRIPPKIQEAQAAVSFIGSCENSAANGADVTLTLPAGMQQNDLVLIAYSIGDNDNVDLNMAMLTSGYTEVADLLANDTQDINLGVYWKIMGTTPDTSAVVDGLGGTDAAVTAVCMVFRGVDTTTPMDVTPTTATALNTMHPNPPSIDHNNPAGLWTVIAGGSGHTLNLANTSDPYTFPTGYTTNAVQRPGNDTSDATVGMGYRTNPADPEDPGVMTHSGTDSTNYAWAAVTMALRPFIPPTFNQSAYRLFNNTDSTDVGTALAAQDTAATLGSTGAAFRLRMLLHIGTSQLSQNGQNFKLQFAQQSGTCDTAFSGETYSDVTAATVIAYSDNATPADNAALTANANDPTHGADTIVNQTYEELNDFTNSQAAIPSGQDGKWDFSLKDNGATANTAYCLRAVKSDGTLLDAYTVIPQITTAVSAVVSVSVSDGIVSYGTIPANTSKSTCASELNDLQTVTNDGDVTENFNIKGQNSANWTLAATAGTDQYVHKFLNATCSTFSGGTALTTTYQTLATGIAASASTNLNLQITTPNPSTVYTQQSVDVTIQAVQQ